VRVLQLISSNGFYGAEGVVVLLSSRMAALGCEVTVGVFNASEQRHLREAVAACGLTVWDLPCAGRFSLRAVVRLVRFVRNAAIDVLHTHGYKANLYGLLAARLTGCTVIATCHNWSNRTLALKRYGLLDKSLLRGFDSAIAVSDTVASTLRQHGFPDEKLHIIHNGIDTARYRETPAPSGNDGPPIIGALSRLSQEKGIDVLVRALPLVLKQYPQMRCVVAGEGPERSRLLTLAAELGVAEHLRLPGFCPDAAVFLASCSIVAHPSRMEGMPLAVLEAMAAGKPIVASAVGGIPALLRGGLAGVLVPAGDPQALSSGILRLLHDSGLRERCAAAAAAHALEHFDVSVMAHTYLNAYQRAVRHSAPRHAWRLVP
jgi:glycosyltransferase involved in cell wall biosynthesis